MIKSDKIKREIILRADDTKGVLTTVVRYERDDFKTEYPIGKRVLYFNESHHIDDDRYKPVQFPSMLFGN